MQQAGYETIVLDLISEYQSFVAEILPTELIVGDVGDRDLLDRLFATRSIMAVTDCAASVVGESVREPAKYYHNKVAQTINKFISSNGSNFYQ